jgi:hyperosmotically inducible protein
MGAMPKSDVWWRADILDQNGRNILLTWMKGMNMKIKLTTTCFLLGALLAPIAGYTADSDTDRSHATAFVKDSVITTKVKTKLAAEHLASLKHIKVDTDKNGIVYLSGTTKTREEADKAISIARDTEGVTSVIDKLEIKNHP